MEVTAPRSAFVLGPGRSGTSLFYKLLALHPEVGFLSNHLSRVPWLPQVSLLQRPIANAYGVKHWSWFDRGGAAYLKAGRSLVRRLIPTPAECEELYAHCGVSLIPDQIEQVTEDSLVRLRESFRRTQRYCGSKILLSKRTANNRRVDLISRAFPDAKYLVIIRDGRAVAHSLPQVDWWGKHTLYWSGQTASQMRRDGMDDLEIAARTWINELRVMQDGLSRLPEDSTMEIRYEDLLSSPQAKLAEVLKFLGLDASEDLRFWTAIRSLNVSLRPEAWRREWTPSQRELVESIQGEALFELGYL